jgi:hypothetical protein
MLTKRARIIYSPIFVKSLQKLRTSLVLARAYILMKMLISYESHFNREDSNPPPGG